MSQLVLETTMSFLNSVVAPILKWAGYEFNYGITKKEEE